MFNSGDRGRKGRPLRGCEGFDVDDLAAGGTRRKVGGKVRRLLGMWVCSSGERKLERKIFTVSAHRGGN